ncbi:MAG: sterol desaturase family protein [Acetobacter sp.]|nr:sterol desaturase family protein [Acetobacter sp.]
MEKKPLKIFRSRWLECFTYMPVTAFVSLWGVVLSVFAYTLVVSDPVPPGRLVGMSALGLLVWFFFEYVMHRFLFHLRLQSRLGKSFLFVMHGNHHECPRDRYRNLMPAIVSVPLAGMLYGLFQAILGPSFGRSFFFGFLCGYVLYDGWHYATHQYRFSNRLLKYIQKHHLQHHYYAPDKNYAVTSPWVDKIFGSACKPTRKR